MALSQRRNTIRAFHAAAAAAGLSPLLEVSTKSEQTLGQALSAFNLRVRSSRHGWISVESAFQASKRFENGGPYEDLYLTPPPTAKKDPRLRTSGEVTSFKFDGEEWPITPQTAFYDYLYLRALTGSPTQARQMTEFAGFTDIEFNPARSINCQVRSCALYAALGHADKLDQVADRSQLRELLLRIG